MALSGTALTETSAFTTNVYPPQANSTVLSNDVAAGEQALANRTKYLNDNKLNLTGGTLTGKLTISPSTAVQGLQVSAGAGSNQNAIQATGDGIGPAIIGTGGNSAAGAAFTAGGGSNFGVRGIGAGTGEGVRGQGGSTGPGGAFANGTDSTTTAPTFAVVAENGGIKLDAVSPNADQDPGANSCIFPQNTPSSSAILVSDGAGGFTVLGNTGFNVDSWTGDSSGVGTVTFARTLPGNRYRRHIDAHDGYDARPNNVRNVGNFQFVVRSQSTNATVDLTTTAVIIEVSTVGY